MTGKLAGLPEQLTADFRGCACYDIVTAGENCVTVVATGVAAGLAPTSRNTVCAGRQVAYLGTAAQVPLSVALTHGILCA